MGIITVNKNGRKKNTNIIESDPECKIGTVENKESNKEYPKGNILVAAFYVGKTNLSLFFLLPSLVYYYPHQQISTSDEVRRHTQLHQERPLAELVEVWHRHTQEHKRVGDVEE